MASDRRIQWPAELVADVYTPCGGCSRCVSGTGRDRDPDASDCYGDYLATAAQAVERRPA